MALQWLSGRDYPCYQYSGRMWQTGLQRAYGSVAKRMKTCFCFEFSIVFIAASSLQAAVYWWSQCILHGSYEQLWAAAARPTSLQLKRYPKNWLFTSLQTWGASYDVYCLFMFGRLFCSQKKAKKIWRRFGIWLAEWVDRLFSILDYSTMCWCTRVEKQTNVTIVWSIA